MYTLFVSFWHHLLQHFDNNKPTYSVVTRLASGLAFFLGGYWALYQYTKSQQKEAAARLLELFKSFYLNSDLQRLRHVLDYDYDTKLRPAIEKVLLNDKLDFTLDEQKLLMDVDTSLNVLEFTLYITSKQLITKQDREIVFDYWYRLLLRPERVAMRMYVRLYNYGTIATMLDKELKLRDKRPIEVCMIAVYGTLRKGQVGQKIPKIKSNIKLVGNCKLPGKLYDLGNYPGLVKGSGEVVAELYEVCGSETLEALDEYEEIDAANANSEYERRCIFLEDFGVDCWVYFYRLSIYDKIYIRSGDWIKYLKKRQQAQSGAMERTLYEAAFYRLRIRLRLWQRIWSRRFCTLWKKWTLGHDSLRMKWSAAHRAMQAKLLKKFNW